MFLRAGFNPREFRRGHVLLWARIEPVAIWKHWRWAQLWCLQSGDVIWMTETFVVWTHTCRIVNIIGKTIYPHRQDYCMLGERPASGA